MLSPGTFHKSVPKDLHENLKFRRWLLLRCRADPKYRKAVVLGCRQDILFHINAFCWQYNPQHEGREVGPFITWDFQDEAVRQMLDCVTERQDLVIEKSREMGATWLCLLVMDWVCRFHKHKKFLTISRNAEAVDRAEDPDCLLWKVRFIDRHLPKWLGGGIEAPKMRVSYPRTESRLTGQASTGKAGVGGRATAAFVDEFSQIEEDREVLARTADTTRCRIFNFTHTDVGTAAYDLSRRPDVKKLVMHWSQHPEKNKGLYHVEENGRVAPHDPAYCYPADYQFVTDGSPTGGPFPGLRSPWYDAECRRRGSTRAVAMDLDINPTGAASQFYEPLVIRRLIQQCKPPEWTGDLFHTTDSARPVELSPSGDGPLSLWLQPGLTSDGKLCRVRPGVYVVAADLGTGQGATPSCLSVFDCSLGQKVGGYTHLWKDPKQFAWLAVSLARLFKSADGEPALLAWETPGPGLTFGNEVLKEIGFRHIYWKTEVFNDEERESDQPGWHANPNNKLHLHTQYRSALATGVFVNYDADALKETLGYVHAGGSVEHPRARKNADPSAAGTNHGDHVVADGLAWLMAKKKAVPVHRPPEEPPPAMNSIQGRRLHHTRQERLARGIWS